MSTGSLHPEVTWLLTELLCSQVRQENRELYSMRCDFLYKLRVAQDNRSEEALYFPHNVDFRGRAYTMHPHLNHLGADYCRGLLMFADARPLGERGLRWLRIQVWPPEHRSRRTLL